MALDSRARFRLVRPVRDTRPDTLVFVPAGMTGTIAGLALAGGAETVGDRLRLLATVDAAFVQSHPKAGPDEFGGRMSVIEGWELTVPADAVVYVGPPSPGRPAVALPGAAERERRARLCKAMADAAIEHGRGVCDMEMAVGDLEAFLGAALELLADDQLAAFWADERVRDGVVDMPEYAAVAREAYGESAADEAADADA